MVDEFQDTNGVQLALIDALRGPRTRLFVVGDEFQSIYRFRHADLEVFRRRRREARQDRRTVERPLRGNFRSRPEVLGGGQLRRLGAARRLHAARGRPGGRRSGGRRRRASPGRRAGGRAAAHRRLGRQARPADRLEGRGDRARAARRRRPARRMSPRRASWPIACASWPTPACRAATWSCCCAPSPTSTPTRRRSSEPAWLPTSSAVAATGRSSRSRTRCGCSAWSRTRSTTSSCSGRSPPRPAA